VKVAHFDCFSGVSGDMTVAALIDAGVDAAVIGRAVDSLGLPVRLEVERVRKGGFAATYVRVEAPAEQSHRFLPEVEEIIGRGALTARQRDLALRVFRRLAQAEATVHGMPLEQVHFHEVGALDSLADITAAAIGLDLLGVERFTSRPVATGGGWGYAPGQSAHLEPTCLALLALSLEPERYAAAIGQGLGAVVRCAGSDGAYRLPAGREEATWPTALVLFVQAALGRPRAEVERTAARLLAIRGRVPKGADAAELLDIDPNLVGWPWAEGTFSWAEPRHGPAWPCAVPAAERIPAWPKGSGCCWTGRRTRGALITATAGSWAG